LKYYRYLEHVGVNEDFNQGYRERKEYDTWRAKDPLELQRAKLLEWFGEAEIRAGEAAIDRQVEQSVKRAEEAPFSKPEELYEDVLA
jgi:pyruvate dehydrogenase E1 component alpha subunit